MSLIDEYKPKLVKTQIGEELFDLLKNIWNDEHFIIGVLAGLKTDEQKQKLINLIEKENETDSDVIILAALDIAEGIEV